MLNGTRQDIIRQHEREPFSLRGRAVLDGVRGAAPADLDALAAVIARAGDLALALGDDLESPEINPLRVDGATIEALGAVVTWARKDND